MKPARSLCQGHPAWAKKARYLSNSFFLARTITHLTKPTWKEQEPCVNYGIVVKKKLGSAVLRNRIKRRLRSAFVVLNQTSPQMNRCAAYIVVVRSASVADLPFSGVCQHLKGVLKIDA